MTALAFLFAAGTLSAFSSGLLGIGGAVVLIPLLLYLGPAAGVALGVHQLTSLSMVYVAAAAASGFLAHRRHGAVHGPLARWLGLGVVAGSLAGGLLQAHLPRVVLLGVFAVLAGTAGLSMLFPLRGESEKVPPVRRLRALAGALPAGFLAATAGVGGASVLLPFMIRVLGVPTRTAIGTSLPLVLLAGVGGVLGRAGAGEIPWLWTAPVLAGAIPGALLGSLASRRMSAAFLRRAFAGVVLALAVGILASLR
ncbi:MAG: sulfite exporter TauE/SafE family protein [Thermaerobacter sp.]|nr:sulfite exporter TauE/SafE family protein [Thermaerobacter sp.]